MTRARTLADLGSASLATDAEATAAASAAAAAVPTGAKNLLYNGAMQVAQRGTSATGLTNGSGNTVKTADRWKFIEGGSPSFVWTQTVEADAPSQFSKSLKMNCTTAAASLNADDLLVISQGLEGQDLQRIAKGTASAQQLTASFWVKSNVTGTYVVELYDSSNTRTVSGTYTVDASATWEYKTITFPADTTGTITDDNAQGMGFNFCLAAGSNFQSGALATSWESATNADRFVGQTNLAAATSNYWQITGVQLEVGDTATEFEHLPYGVELARCQRYYEVCAFNGAAWITSATTVRTGGNWHVIKRATPSAHGSGGSGFISYGPGGTQSISAIGAFQGTESGFLFDAANGGGMTTNAGAVIQVSVYANAEL